jgi:hypothetical protein
MREYYHRSLSYPVWVRAPGQPLLRCIMGSVSDYTAELNLEDLPVGRCQKGIASTGRYVMSEATNFRLYADEALHESFKAVREEEKRALEDLACTWAAAALASDRIFGPTTTSWRPLLLSDRA